MIEKIVAPIRRRLRLLVTRGVVKLINDAAKMQELQITGLADEVLDGVERIQQYGFTAHPHPDADCLVLNVGASRSHPVVIAVDDRRYRLHLSEGEVAMYDDQGQAVKLLRGGIVIESANGSAHNGNLTVNGNTTINGDLTVNGNGAITGSLTIGGIDFAGHTHPGDSGGTTGVPQ
ncbi:MAG: phage baseplate assembly protein V [Mariprofundaceae bacterium]|nr:phage baseplate assembly protein V [Mariprofundaceae bacterium]